ncbi:MAG: rRNA maturation RNase YbeY [Chloroflexota bacterium]
MRQVDASLDLEVRFHVRRRSGARLNRRDLRAVCAAAVAGEGVEGLALLTVTFVDDDEIQQINQQHRGIDRPTDVLSFPLVDDSVGFALPPDAPRELGDVIVSYPRAVAQAEEYGHSVEREVAYLVVHGVLHILGHDHEVPAEQALMRAREESALAVAGLLREP